MRKITINNLTFVQTSIAFPEQYDVFDASGNRVAYVRVRYGITCDYPYAGGERIYCVEDLPNVNCYGCFPNETERMKHLTAIAHAIMNKVNKATMCAALGADDGLKLVLSPNGLYLTLNGKQLPETFGKDLDWLRGYAECYNRHVRKEDDKPQSSNNIQTLKPSKISTNPIWSYFTIKIDDRIVECDLTFTELLISRHSYSDVILEVYKQMLNEDGHIILQPMCIWKM